jgi:hypothetical protein
MEVLTRRSQRMVLRPLVALAVLTLGALAGCTNDDTNATDGTPTAGDGGGSSGSSGSSGASGSSGSSGNPLPDGSVPTPGTILAFPLDVALVTFTKPFNIDNETNVIVASSMQYFSAYDPGSTTLNDEGRYFRFVIRTHLTPEELPPGGSLVWWRKLSDDNVPGSYVCRTTDIEDRITAKRVNEAGDAAEPDPLYRNQCSWTLWKHATEDKWLIRAPQGKSDANGGMMVTERHGTVTEGGRIRVDGSTIGQAPYFTFFGKK